MDRKVLVSLLQEYRTESAEEQRFIPAFLGLLSHPNAFLRSHLPGHVTGSAWIIDTSRKFVLLTHHAKLNRWLQPGGHADGDENVLNVAQREATEETGLTDLRMVQNGIFDIDIHTIPSRKDFPEHSHYDIRFVFEANKDLPLQLTDESHALEWVDLGDLAMVTNNNGSMLRMADKMRLL